MANTDKARDPKGLDHLTPEARRFVEGHEETVHHIHYGVGRVFLTVSKCGLGVAD